jgi:hypothetical protein
MNLTWDGGSVTPATNFLNINSGASLTAEYRRVVGNGSFGTFSQTNSLSSSRICFGILIASQSPTASPHTITLLIDTGDDDAAQTTSGVVTLTDTNSANNLDAVGEWVGTRFQRATIPIGATINTAIWNVIPFANTTDEPDVQIYLEDADNAAIYTTAASSISSRARTTGTAWSSADLGATATTRHSSPDVANGVQTVINRGGWASGNALNVIVQGSANSARDLIIKMYESATGARDAAELIVTFTPAAVGGTLRRYTLTTLGVG